MKKVYIFLPKPFKYEGTKLIEDFKLIDIELVVHTLPYLYDGDLNKQLKIQASELLKCGAAMLNGIKSSISPSLETDIIIPALREVAEAIKIPILNFEQCIDAIRIKKEENEKTKEEDATPTSEDIMKFLFEALFANIFDNKEKDDEPKLFMHGHSLYCASSPSACGKYVPCCQCPESADCKYITRNDRK